MISAVSAVVEEAYRNVIVDGRVMAMVLVVSTESVAPAVIGLRTTTKRESGRNGKMAKGFRGKASRRFGDDSSRIGDSEHVPAGERPLSAPLLLPSQVIDSRIDLFF